MMSAPRPFNPHCRHCRRLTTYLQQVKLQHPDYFCQPVPAFGDPAARLLIVGLAPGLHGANATGRAFTGDASGTWLYQTLFKFGFSSAAESLADDDLMLYDCRITNAVKCLPPQNKPSANEIRNCNKFLRYELEQLPQKAVVIALGCIAHNAVLRASGLPLSSHTFAHAAKHQFKDFTLLDSYHCSRYNTQTRRLSREMFEEVFAQAEELLGSRQQRRHLVDQ